MNHGRGNKRRRRRPPAGQFHHSSVNAAEERFLHQAIIQNSTKLDKGRQERLQVPYGPTFYPTIADFEGSPLDYIEEIRPIAERYGICKIVPPEGWNPAPFGIDFDSTLKFQTKRQYIQRLQEGISFGDGVEYSVQEYQNYASAHAKGWKQIHYPNHDLLKRHADSLKQEQSEDSAQSEKETQAGASGVANGTAQEQQYTTENLERDYWNVVEGAQLQQGTGDNVMVDYGNDVDTNVFGSGFPLSERGRALSGTNLPEKVAEPEPKFGSADYYKESWWNLNNIPCAPRSVLRHVRVGINGINVPWMYYGSLFSTFCWHNEDNYLYSINYHHKGAPKQWYGVPGDKTASDGLEKVFKSYLSMKMRDVPDLLHHITTMFSPRLLQNAKVPVYKLVQHQGEYVVTFPRSFHGGFSYGPNIGEAVNFATHDWISFGSDANERYRSFSRPSVFSHDRLTFTMANHLHEQTTYKTCKLLLEDLERVVEEELNLRRDLQHAGVRDISKMVDLPRNSLDQLDEESANYDDKRLCHACKHVCFFSAVGCQCSQSKVSCLRHSHYMCRCPTTSRYFMIWSTDVELKSTVERVRMHCESLKSKETCQAASSDKAASSESNSAVMSASLGDACGKTTDLPVVAPGVIADAERHKNDDIPSTDSIGKHSFALEPKPCVAKSSPVPSAALRVVSESSVEGIPCKSSNASGGQ